MQPQHADDAEDLVLEDLEDQDVLTRPASRQLPGVGAVQGALGAFAPLARTGRYYAGAWRKYLDGKSDDVPQTLPSPGLLGHALRDELVLLGLRARRPLSKGPEWDRIDREVRDALELYGSQGWLDEPETFFAAPPVPEEMTIFHVHQRGRSYERFVFKSSYTPHPEDPGGLRWQSYAANNQVYGLMLRHREPRPWLVCVHGTEMGRAGVDLALFRAWHLHHDFGLNVMLPVLPQHGPRGRGLPKGKAFPGEEILDDVHFAGQAVSDVRQVLAWIREQDPKARVGVNGISMGGYVAAMVASLETDLTCAILGVPVADLVDVLSRHAGFGKDDPRLETIKRAEPLGRMISPLSMTPKVPMSGRFIYGGVADRVVHPRDQVVRLWEHWGQPEIVWYKGGHTGFFTARPVQKLIDAAIVQSGLVNRPV